jgi:hypothetical protein
VPAFYAAPASTFLEQDPQHILGILTEKSAAARFTHLIHSQTSAWLRQIQILKSAFAQICNLSDWSILLEYPIPRRGKRIDAVLFAPGCILVAEFKCGATAFDRAAIVQLEDYCLDLRDFHRESRGLPIVPVLIATEASPSPVPEEFTSDQVQAVWTANAQDLAPKLIASVARYGRSAPPPQITRWNDSDYHPTPTIIEAAQALYAGNNVQEISRCHAGIENLTITSKAVIDLIASTRARSEKVICFVTGVPGAGKTLAGLNVVHNHSLHEGELGVFLSGNGPLVKVLTEALARDHRIRSQGTLQESRREVTAFIQNVHRFVETYFKNTSKIPVDRVIVFDEAQRAWDAEQSLRKFDRNFSEPEIMLGIMDRCPDWAVIVALVGVGQEINSGEAGLAEWGRTLSDKFTHWRIAISKELMVGSQFGTSLFSSPPSHLDVIQEKALHLKVSLRSYKAERLTQFVDALLTLDSKRARELRPDPDDYPIYLTRSLDAARAWLRRRQRGTRRTGLVASSGARRLLAYGLDVTAELDVENWFLNPPTDVRSSYFLETVATEFGIQGLELDWIGLCWGGDLIPSANGWEIRKFRGTTWQNTRDQRTRDYAVNKYRVLLTRAREGLIIWVPEGSTIDDAQSPLTYDRVAEYLTACGIPMRLVG